MLSRVHLISETRDKRENHAAGRVSGMFWFAAVAGVAFIALAYYPHPPERYSLILLGIFGAYTGVIVFFIHAFANPFAEPGALDPGAFLRLLSELSPGFES